MAAGFEGHREGERESARGCARRRRRRPLRDGMRAAPPSAARGQGRTEGARRAQEGHDAGGRCPPVRSDGAHAAVPGGALPGRGGRGPAGPRRAFGALSGGHGQKRLARQAQARAFGIEARIGHARPGSREGGGRIRPRLPKAKMRIGRWPSRARRPTGILGTIVGRPGAFRAAKSPRDKPPPRPDAALTAAPACRPVRADRAGDVRRTDGGGSAP